MVNKENQILPNNTALSAKTYFNKQIAKITLPEGSIELPILIGSEQEKGFDISDLRGKTSYITMDSGYGNTGSCVSSITYIDGEKGILRYRGYPIEQLAEKSDFVETAYLLIYGHLPTVHELQDFNKNLISHAMIHEDMKRFFDDYPSTAHPMAILSSMICSLSAYYPDSLLPTSKEEFDLVVARLLAKVRTIAAFSYKKSVGQPFVYPQDNLSYCANFLNMMFHVPGKDYKIDDDIVAALNLLLVLHADHEQNCSTSTVRMVGSSQANIFAAVSAGICALWGKLHGGANQAVLEMLQQMHKEGGDCAKYIEKAKDKTSNFRLMGFGHRVYKNYDPRAAVIKKMMDKVLSKLGVHDPLLEIALKLEALVLKDSYFIERKLYPNVDFYSGIIYQAIGIPINMFTVMFSMGRLPGWIAHYREMMESPDTKIGRPRQIYTGPTIKDYVPISKRK